MAKLDTQNRAEKVEVLPDQRLRVSQIYDVLDYIPRNGEASFLTEIKLPWGTPHPTYANCRLVKQDENGQIENPFKKPNDPPPQLIRVWEEIPANNQVIVGEPSINYDQYGRKTVEIDYVQFSAGTTIYNYVVGTTTAPAPNSACVLKTYESTNDGTLIRKHLTFIDSGVLSDNEELKFDGKLKLRTITALNEIPATPTGYTPVTQSIEYVQGLPVYRYGFASAASSIGLGGEISRSTEYKLSPDQGTTGVTVTTIEYLTDQSVNTNPISGPGGSELIEVTYRDNDGFRTWRGVYASGTGLVKDDKDIRNGGKLIVYSRTAINAAPSAPSATIGGTVVLINQSQRNGTDATAGTIVYDYQWAEGNGQISLDVEGREDGSLVYTVVELSATASAPANPTGGTAYCTKLDQAGQGGYWLNRAVWIKLPATRTYKKQITFSRPGLALFNSDVLQLLPPTQQDLLADCEVSYGTTQDSTTPWSVLFYASLYELYTPADTGIQVANIRGLGGYLAGANFISGTNSAYNGVICTEWEATLISSSPTSRPTGVTTIAVDNDPYLTDINGTAIYRRSVTSYDFP